MLLSNAPLFPPAPALPSSWYSSPRALLQLDSAFSDVFLAWTELGKSALKASQDRCPDVAVWMGLTRAGGGCCKVSPNNPCDCTLSISLVASQLIRKVKQINSFGSYVHVDICSTANLIHAAVPRSSRLSGLN